MNIIAAADAGWGIGKEGDLIYNIPEDMKFFRETTREKTVVMGRATLESLPGGRPLPKRRNIILSSSLDAVEGAEVCKDTEELKALLEGEKSENVFVIGGERVYRELLPLCDTAYITRIDAKSDADRFLVNFDEEEDWEEAESSPTMESGGIKFRFVTYKRK